MDTSFWSVGPYYLGNNITIGLDITGIFWMLLFSIVGVTLEILAQKRQHQTSVVRLVARCIMTLVVVFILLFTSLGLHEVLHAVTAIAVGAGFKDMFVNGGYGVVNALESVGPIRTVIWLSAGSIGQIILGLYLLVGRKSRSIRIAGAVIVLYSVFWQLYPTPINDLRNVIANLHAAGVLN